MISSIDASLVRSLQQHRPISPRLIRVTAATTAALSISVAFNFQSATADDSTTSSASVSTESGSHGQSKTLQGGVNHSEQLPSLQESLRPGSDYSDDLLLKSGIETNDLWYYIPAWYAGTRHVDDNFIFYRYDYKTKEETQPMLRQLNRQDSTAGCLRDRKGGIWDFKHTPIIQHVESDRVNAVLFVRRFTPLAGNEDRLVLKYDEISVSIDKKSNKIVEVTQQEQINTVTNPHPGTLRVDASTKSFAWDGTPQRLEQAVMISKITKPFEPRETLNGVNLPPLFKDYLVSHHLADLVPEDLSK
ncbi:MAG TPA: hypothetical protein V6C97_06360 [Oculatellaceae cyanobacterium]